MLDHTCSIRQACTFLRSSLTHLTSYIKWPTNDHIGVWGNVSVEAYWPMVILYWTQLEVSQLCFPTILSKHSHMDMTVKDTELKMKSLLIRLRVTMSARNLQHKLALILWPSGPLAGECNPILPQDMPSFGIFLRGMQTAESIATPIPLIWKGVQMPWNSHQQSFFYCESNSKAKPNPLAEADGNSRR